MFSASFPATFYPGRCIAALPRSWKIRLECVQLGGMNVRWIKVSLT